jgi:hypothetical protein
LVALPLEYAPADYSSPDTASADTKRVVEQCLFDLGHDHRSGIGQLRFFRLVLPSPSGLGPLNPAKFLISLEKSWVVELLPVDPTEKTLKRFQCSQALGSNSPLRGQPWLIRQTTSRLEPTCHNFSQDRIGESLYTIEKCRAPY